MQSVYQLGVQPESAEYEAAVEADTRRCREWIES